MEEKPGFFSHIKGLKKEIVVNNLAILFAALVYIFVYKLSGAFAAFAIAFAIAFAVFAAGVAFTAGGAFAAFATVVFAVFAVFAALECKKEYSTSFYKPFLLSIWQAVVFGLACYHGSMMPFVFGLYAVVTLYIVMINKLIVNYLTKHPPKSKLAEFAYVGKGFYRSHKMKVYPAISPNRFYVLLYNFFVPKQEESQIENTAS